MIRCSVGWLLVVFAAGLHAPTALAQPAIPQRFPLPLPPPCAAPNVVPTAVAELADKTAAATRIIDDERTGAWRAVREFTEAACRAGDRVALDTVLERCIRECVDEGDRYLAHLDYAAALARFGDAAAAAAQYQAAIAMRPGRPSEAIEAYNNYALLLQRDGRPLEALDLLNRFAAEELRTYSFAATLKLWVMRELGMDTSAEQAALYRPSAGAIGGMRPGLFPPLPGTPDERPLDRPLVVEVREDVTINPGRPGGAAERRTLYFNRMSTGSRPTGAPERFTVTAGERFVMLATLGGDACRIELRGNYYDLVSCPWLRESGDTQRDLYRVRPRARPAAAAAAPRLPQAPVVSPLGGEPTDGAPPDWLIWQTFYLGLEPFGRSAPAFPEERLGEAGLTLDEATSVLSARRVYLERLTAIDAAARTEIAARFAAPAFEPPLPPQSTAAGDRPRVLVPAQTPDGRSVQAILAEEGFIARIEADKEAAFAAHRERLARAIGTTMLARLEAFVRGQAGDVRRAVPPAAPAEAPPPLRRTN